MQKEELFHFMGPEMQNIGGGGELMCSCHLVSILAPSPVNGLFFWLWSRSLKSSFYACHAWVWPHEQLTTTNWLGTCIAAKSLRHTSGHLSIAFQLWSVSLVPCSVCFLPFQPPSIVRELRTQFWTRQWGLNSEKMLCG